MLVSHCLFHAGKLVYVVDVFVFVGLFKELLNDVPAVFCGLHFVYFVAVPDL
jgi:hypothetical protein